ncbi:MAG: TIGR04282 family arsenosugar biosynthesis glycosyltransferase [Acidimicrobiia bacterium]|nr:TIGR04282 family arsenosugar biosynthesis glycosyltransferase [Acidimicrobiia bacterium]
MTERRRAVIVMAKQPDPATTKTRLHGVLAPAEAARLYECFLRDTIELVDSVPDADSVIAFHPADARPYFASLAPGAALVAQVGDALDDRLEDALGRLLDHGYDQVAAIGSDSPNLPADRLIEAFGSLDDPGADLVLGPADDGGYYLIATVERPGPLVTGITMSTPTVLADTLARAERAGIRVVLLERWYDVDEPADLARLRTDLATAPDSVARHTRAFLSERRPTIAAVVPALDEGQNIAEVVRRTSQQCVADVIVVDNGSVDDTATVAAAAGATVVAEARRGYGYACAAGVAEARRRGAEIIAFLDGDLSSPPEELPSIVEPLLANRADLVLGSRVQGRIASGAMPTHQRIGNALSAWLLRRLYGLEVTDLGPFRAIRVDVLESLDMTEMTFGWPTEMTVKAARSGTRIEEVPVSWLRRSAGRSKVSGTVRGSILAARHIIGVTVRYALPGRR